MVYITVSTGIGGGLIIDGKLYRGASGIAGEIGHITIDPEGPLCGCGNRGCLEALASGVALAAQGEGLIARGDDDAWCDRGFRRRLYREYGTFVSSLRGCYITAEDAGTSPLDIAEVFRTTRFLTCIPPESGGSGNPSRMTAAGVVCGIEAALDFLGQGSLANKKIVLQGTGNVGSEMIQLLLHHGVRQIVASEICEERRAALLDSVNGHAVEVRPTRAAP